MGKWEWRAKAAGSIVGLLVGLGLFFFLFGLGAAAFPLAYWLGWGGALERGRRIQ